MGDLNNTESVLSQIYNKQERSYSDMFEPRFSNGRFTKYYMLFIMDIYSLKLTDILQRDGSTSTKTLPRRNSEAGKFKHTLEQSKIHLQNKNKGK